MAGQVDADVIVVGAGLAGATAAWCMSLKSPHLHVRVLDARDRAGGRLVSPPGGLTFDLGAGWTWPSHDKELNRVAEAIGVDTVAQWSTGEMLVQASDDRVHRVARCSFSEEHRFCGGTASIVRKLFEQSRATLRTGHAVSRVCTGADGVLEVHAVRSTDGEKVVLRAHGVIVAVPPPVVTATIAFEPPLPPKLAHALAHTPVWMADVAKVIVTFSEPFWRDVGLSGSASCMRGPIRQWWDNTDLEMRDRDVAAGTASLAGFAVGDEARLLAKGGEQTVEAIERVLAQLRALFGERAADPVAVRYCAWPGEEWTADPTARTLDLPPIYGAEVLRIPPSEYSGRLIFAGTETEDEHGHMEGAVKSGKRAARAVRDVLG